MYFWAREKRSSRFFKKKRAVCGLMFLEIQTRDVFFKSNLARLNCDKMIIVRLDIKLEAVLSP